MNLFYNEQDIDVIDSTLIREEKKFSVSVDQISREHIKQDMLLMHKTDNKLERIVLLLAIVLIGFGASITIFASSNAPMASAKSYYFLNVLVR